jgi:hypothetical protein
MNQWDPGSSCQNSCQSNYEIPQTSRLHTSAQALYSLNFSRSTPPPGIYPKVNLNVAGGSNMPIYIRIRKDSTVLPPLSGVRFFLADIFGLIARLNAATCFESEID